MTVPVPVHPRWRGRDLPGIGAALATHLGTGPLDLIHAWGNLIWTDRRSAYKITDPRVGHRATMSITAVAALLAADPGFPTIPPADPAVHDLDLGEHGRWALTIWTYRDVSPIGSAAHHLSTYRCLGGLLARLHAVDLPGLPPHDPLCWARDRIATLPPGPARDALTAECAVLAAAHTDAFPPVGHVTVHGDLHWQQVVTDTDGRLLLLDFENASTGHPAADLVPSAGWAARTGTPTREQIHALHDGYGPGRVTLTDTQGAVLAAVAEFSRRTWDLCFPVRQPARG